MRRLALAVPLQDRQDVAGQHIPGVQGEKWVLFLCNLSLGCYGSGSKAVELCPSKLGFGFHQCSSPPSLQGTSVCQVTVIGATVILLYTSRACYNLVVLALANKSINSFDYDWYNVSDQVIHQPGLVDRLLRFINLPDQSESLQNLLDLTVWRGAQGRLLKTEV